jgi:hypothetical protein
MPASLKGALWVEEALMLLDVEKYVVVIVGSIAAPTLAWLAA